MFGRSLANMPVWRYRLADLMSELKASRLLRYYATDPLCAGDPAGEVYASMAKLFKRLAPGCGQLFGGYGRTEEHFVAPATGVHQRVRRRCGNEQGHAGDHRAAPDRLVMAASPTGRKRGVAMELGPEDLRAVIEGGNPCLRKMAVTECDFRKAK